MSRSRNVYRKIAESLPAGFINRLSWQYVSALVTVFTGFLYSIIVARFLGASAYGILALAAATSTLLVPLLHTNMRDYLVRYVARDLVEDRTDAVFGQVVRALLINLASTVLYCGAMWAGAHLLASIWAQGDSLAQAIPLAALSIAAQIYLSDAASGILRVLNRVRAISIVQIAAGIIRVMTTWIVFKLFSGDLFAVMLISALAYLGLAASLWVVTFRTLEEDGLCRPKADLSWRTFLPDTEGRGFLFRNYLSYLFSIPSKDLDVNILGFFTNLESVGIYRMAKNFMAILWSVTDPIHLVLYPEYSRLWHQGAMQKIRRLTLVFTGVLGLTAIAIFAIGSFVVPFAIRFLAGSTFAGSGMIYVLMTTSIIIWLPLIWYNPLFIAAGRNDVTLHTTIVGAVLGCLIYLVAGRWFGAVGMAVACSVNIAMLVALQTVFGWRSGVLKDLVQPRSRHPANLLGDDP